MRRLIAFPCEGACLVGTLDEGDGTTGLLIVSGGNEIRCGAHRGMAELAARLAGEGTPVFRFDRRGVGDSEGENHGFESALPDLAAAVATFRAEAPQLDRIVAFGNCDAASALALFHREAGIDSLVLANPWTEAEADDLPPPAAIRARYAERLREPREWLRLIRGGVNLAKLAKGLSKVARRTKQDPNTLPARLGRALRDSETPVTVVLARGDATAIAFRDAWAHADFASVRDRATVTEIDTASHSFAQSQDKQRLGEAVRHALEASAG